MARSVDRLQQGVNLPSKTHLVHLRLGEHGLIPLIVAMAAVADDVNDDVTLPGLPPIGCQLMHSDHCLCVIPVHVEDGRIQGLGNVRAVGRAAALLGVSRESHLKTAQRLGLRALFVMGSSST